MIVKGYLHAIDHMKNYNIINKDVLKILYRVFYFFP